MSALSSGSPGHPPSRPVARQAALSERASSSVTIRAALGRFQGHGLGEAWAKPGTKPERGACRPDLTAVAPVFPDRTLPDPVEERA